MSNYTWYPGAMSFPADRLNSSYYPYAPKYGSKPARGCSANGLKTAYPTYSNNCQSCSGRAPSACSNKYPFGFGGRGYYNPSGTPYNALLYGTRAGTCDPKRGCLDPRARNYNKMALTHCQSMCIYPQPKVCIGERPTIKDERCTCALDENGHTPTEAIYDDRHRNSRSSRIQKHARYHQSMDWKNQY